MVWSSACTWLPYAGAPLMLHFFIDFVNVFAKFFLPGIGILSQSPIAVIFLFLDFLDVWKIKIHNYQQKYWTIMWFIITTIFNWRANLSKLQISRDIITAVSNNIHYNNDGYLSGQDEPNPALWNPNGQDGAILPTRDYPLYPERKVSPKAIDKKSFGALGGALKSTVTYMYRWCLSHSVLHLWFPHAAERLGERQVSLLSCMRHVLFQ